MSSDEVVYWGPYCGDEKRDQAFWDPSLSVNTTTPDLTECFQNTVLVWVPCFYLWIFTPFYFLYLRSQPTLHRLGHVSKLNMLKVLVGILLVFFSIIELVRALGESTDGADRYPVHFVTPVIFAVTYVITTILSHYEFLKGVHSSGILIIFWLLLTLTGIVPFRTYIMSYDSIGYIKDRFRFTIFFINYSFVVLQLIMSLISDHSALEKQGESNDDVVIFDASEKTPLLAKEEDENGKQKRPPCPELRASFVSKIFYFWLTKLIIKGYKTTLGEDSLWDLKPGDKSKYIYHQFRKHWMKQVSKVVRAPVYMFHTNGGQSYQKVDQFDHDEIKATHDMEYKTGDPSLIAAYSKVFGVEFFLGGLLKLISDILMLIQPTVLGFLIDFTESKSILMWQGYAYALLLFVIAIIKTVVVQYYQHTCYHIGLQLRSAVIAAIYRKAIVLSSGAKKQSTQGEIVNLMSVDAQKLQDVPPQLHFIWTSPIILIAALVQLWFLIGPSALAGVVILILLIPINGFIATKVKTYQVGQMKHKDTRLKVVNEVLNGIKVLKLYAWEPSYEDKIGGIRDKELEMLRKSALLQAYASITWFIAPFLVALGTFAAYVLSDPENILDANTAFVSLAYINIMNQPMAVLPMVVATTISAMVSMKRIKKFLLLEEIDEDNVEHDPKSENAIEISNANLMWSRDEEPVLRNINLQIPDGKLVAIVGTVGAGKSSLISSMLGELYKDGGRINVRGSVAYVPQQAWLVNDTLKNNILFGKIEQRAKYDSCIEACALGSDLKILPGGDSTEIGEKGINLSGGQKQRVSLARAVYQNSDLYILDDPLSAVDAHVGKHIFNKVISDDGLLAGKTRVFVTHSVAFLPRTDYIVVIKDGYISEMGTYSELLKHDGAFADFIRTYLQEEAGSSDEDDDPEEVNFRKQLQRQISVFSGDESEKENQDVSDTELRKVMSNRESRMSAKRRRISEKKEIEEVKKSIKENRLTTDEISQVGEVKWSVYKAYIKANGISVVIGCLVSWILYIGCSVGTNFWLSDWSSDQPINGVQDPAKTDLRLGVYAALGLGMGIFIMLESICIALGNIKSSRVLHKSILARVLRAPMSFFDTTPLGRLVNRLSKDIDTMDIMIPLVWRFLLFALSQVLGTVVVISITTPPFLAFLLPLGILYGLAQRFYISTTRQLKRIDSVLRSPIYSHFGATLSGATSIRAYGHTDRFIKIADEMVDKNQMAYYPNIVAMRWIGVNLENLGNIVILVAAILAVLTKDTLTGGLVGLSLSYALSVTAFLTYVVRMQCDLETYIVAVERIIEYTTLETEADWEIPHKKPPSVWPDQGGVAFNRYSARYRAGLDLVLKTISCKVQPGEKVGIVGRTGAGKSSLTMALFRLIEPADGTISIDDLDISRIGLHDLRGRITIIPQDPVLFSGTLRSNLDPFGHYTDNALWAALEQSHLKIFAQSQAEGLDFQVSEGGENMSVGQRQLLCLARALLKKSKILVLDEATSAVDLETDDLIQNTIRSKFKDWTVLTIAHRLNTIMDYDRVMVLDKGQIKEFDSPSNLMKDKQTIFHGMARDAGLI